MYETPIYQRVFPFKLAAWLPLRYESYLHWLHHLLERLGPESTLAVWQDAAQHHEDGPLLQVLSTGWMEVAREGANDVEETLAGLLPRYFPAAIQGVSPEEARRLVEATPPIRQIRQACPTLNVVKQTTAYEALHLRMDGPALLAEALIRRHAKQGELIAYDLLREGRIQSGGGQTGSIAEFIADFVSEPQEPDLFSVGLEIERVAVSEQEAVVHVRGCAWADYFRERHPQVGYLMACSTDEAAYRAFNPGLRLQRSSTLMEGGELCDFRIYCSIIA